MVNNTVYQFVGLYLGVEISLEKREHQKKDALKYVFQKNSIYMHFLHLCYVLAKILRNCTMFIRKPSLGFKNCMKNLESFRKAVESPKSWHLLGHFCPTDTFLHIKDYIQRIYLTLLSTTWVKIYQMTYAIFEIVGHFLQHNSSLFV